MGCRGEKCVRHDENPVGGGGKKKGGWPYGGVLPRELRGDEEHELKKSRLEAGAPSSHAQGVPGEGKGDAG